MQKNFPDPPPAMPHRPQGSEWKRKPFGMPEQGNGMSRTISARRCPERPDPGFTRGFTARRVISATPDTGIPERGNRCLRAA